VDFHDIWGIDRLWTGDCSDADYIMKAIRNIFSGYFVVVIDL